MTPNSKINSNCKIGKQTCKKYEASINVKEKQMEFFTIHYFNKNFKMNGRICLCEFVDIFSVVRPFIQKLLRA